MKTETKKTFKKAYYYNIGIDWISERTGILSNPGLKDKIEVSFPNERVGIWSPEHFLIAALNSCFMISFLAVAEKSKLKFSHYNCSGKGKVEKVNGKYLMTEIKLAPVLTIKKLADKKSLEEILQHSLDACLISNSIKSKVSLLIKVNIIK